VTSVKGEGEGAEVATVTCSPALPTTIGLDIGGPTALSCSATAESNGITATLDMFISVLDTEAPTIDAVSVPSDMTVEATSSAGAPVVFSTPTATDASGVDPTVDVNCDANSGDTFPFDSPGPTTTTVTCTAEDDSFNTDSASFDVTVEDTTAPVFGAIADITAEATSPAGATVSFSLPSATDAVDSSPSVICVPAAGSLFALGQTEVSCTATDASSNSSLPDVGVFQVTVEDMTAPVFDPIADIVAEATSPAGAVVNYALPTATDIADANPGVTCTPGSGSQFPLGASTITCEATDADGNSSTATFQATVEDMTAPVFNPIADVVAEATSPAGALVNYALPTATDIADANPGVACAPGSGSQFPLGVSTITCTATDVDSNSATATFQATVEDTTAPVFNPIADVVAEATSPAGALVNYALPTAIDIADANPGVACAPGSGSQFPLGASTITCTATDTDGNSATATFQANVEDTTAPTFNSIDDVVAEATSPAGAVVNYALPTATDIADVNPIVMCAPPAASSFIIGATTVTCTAADADGNSVTGAFQVTIQDTTVPVIALLGDAPLTVEVGTPYVESGATVIDIADPAPVLIINSALVNTAAVGSYSVFYDAVDATGNAALQVVRTVNVVDTTEPSLDGFDPPEFDQDEPFVLDPDLSTFALIWTGGVDDTDPDLDVSCDVGGFVSADPPLYTFSYDFFPAGITVVTCTATDSNNNSDSVSFTVTVLDETAPVITLLGDSTVTVGSDSEPYVDAGATAIDNADGNVAVDIDSSAVDTSTPGSYTVNFSATDNAGNTSVATRTVNVEFAYAGSTGVDPAKTNLKLGSSNPLLWAWLDSNGNPVDSSGDTQLLRVEFCDTGEVVFMVAGDPGSSGFRINVDNTWQFNLQYNGNKGDEVCAVVQSSLSGQEQSSPPITYR